MLRNIYFKLLQKGRR